MIDFDITPWMPLIVALLASTGMWKYFSMKQQHNHNKSIQYQKDRALFSKTLKHQVDRLSEKVDLLTSEKEILLIEMAKIRAEIAAAAVTIQHLQELLRSRSPVG